MPFERFKTLRVLNTKGTVRLVKNIENGSLSVLKELTPDNYSIYRRLAGLRPHDNLERIYECDDNAALCEYFGGTTLRELLDSKRTFSLSQIKKIITQLCRAVEFLHKNGMIHRDINPNNIMLDAQLHLKLIDFGISRIYNGRQDQDTTILGTEGYSAPEQYGFRETGFTADVYSIGITLKILLNSGEDIPAIQEVVLRKIAAKCTAFSPDDRYSNASAVLKAFRRMGLAVPAVISLSVLSLVGLAAALFSLLHSAADREKLITPASETTEMTTPFTGTVSSAPASTASVQTMSVQTQEAQPAVIAEITEEQATVPTTADTKAIQTTVPSSPAASEQTSTVTTTTKSATHTTTSVSAQDPEPIEIAQPLHRSDMDDPQKIEITTRIDENGYYCDYFEYEFYDDPAVVGDWIYCHTIPVSELTSSLTADYILNSEDVEGRTIISLSVRSGGSAEICYYNNGDINPDARWTNGYLIDDIAESTAAHSMFAVTLDGVEFLFVGVKTGDFFRDNIVLNYVIFVRQ